MSNATIRKNKNKSSGGLAAQPITGKAKSSKTPRVRKQTKQKTLGTPQQRIETVPVALSLTAWKSDPVIRADGKTCRVKHSELIGNLLSPSNYAFSIIRRFRLNPGSVEIFEWLSNMSVNYESYRFHMLKLHYLTRSSTDIGGSVMISADYDAADGAAVLTEKALYNNHGSVDCAPWKNTTWTADTKSMNRLYKSHTCMSDARFATTQQDPKTIDVGQVFVAAEVNTQAEQAMGKLIVEYDVEFFDPQVPTESVSLGGMRYYTNDITPNSTTPTRVYPLRIDTQPGSEKIMETGAPYLQLLNIANNTAKPTIGQFLRDYEGVLNCTLQGTGLNVSTSIPNFWVRKATDAAYQAGQAPSDVLLEQVVNPIGDIINAASTDLRIQRIVKALKGDMLAMETGTATSLNSMQLDLFGVTEKVLKHIPLFY
jgi:hypothetical protein